MNIFNVKTTKRAQMVDITREVQECIDQANINEGLACVFVPHTTAAVTINENADPDVVIDVLNILEKSVPESSSYGHSEGNSDSHAKSSLVGVSCTVIIENGKLQLGTWQSIYFAEFDGPRSRKCFVKIIS